MRGTISIGMSNNQALHVWAIMIDYIERTTQELKASRVLKKDGTRNLNKKYISDASREQLDNLVLAELIYKHIENNADFSEIEKELSRATHQKAAAERGKDG